MARVKPTAAPILETWEAVDQALKRVGQINRIIASVEADTQKTIDEAKEKAERRTADALAEKAVIEKNLEDFCSYYRDRFGDKKSRDLNFGVVGFRMASKLITLKGWNWKRVADKLSALKLRQYLIEKVSVDKEAIKKANIKEARLKAFGLAIEEKESFYYEPDETKIADVPSM